MLGLNCRVLRSAGDLNSRPSLLRMQETAGKRDDLLTQVREAQEERLRLQKRATEVSAESAKLSEEMVILGQEVNSLRVRAGNLFPN